MDTIKIQLKQREKMLLEILSNLDMDLQDGQKVNETNYACYEARLEEVRRILKMLGE